MICLNINLKLQFDVFLLKLKNLNYLEERAVGVVKYKCPTRMAVSSSVMMVADDIWREMISDLRKDGAGPYLERAWKVRSRLMGPVVAPRSGRGSWVRSWLLGPVAAPVAAQSLRTNGRSQFLMSRSHCAWFFSSHTITAWVPVCAKGCLFIRTSSPSPHHTVVTDRRGL